MWKFLTPKNVEEHLPQRVREEILRQEDQTERLIGWLQLIVVLVFGALYIISPKTGPMDPPFLPVPWVLGVYLCLTLLRIFWAYRRRLPSWAVALSIVIDILVLMGMIWSFHIQYMQPASFYLKAPTILYIFIFIALRALRFDARFVFLTGLVAALGWGGMVGYVVYDTMETSPITRDYIVYLTSNSVLLGAEFDKIISILVVSILLGVALLRGRSLLVRAVSESIAAAELSRFFSPEIADHIKGAETEIHAGNADVCDAAILSLDMRGFTRLAEQEEPQKVIEILGEYQKLCVPIVQRHGGTIDKFLGDGILATFGTVGLKDSYAAAAMRAIEEILATTQDWHKARLAKGLHAPRVNAALADGRILFGAVGDETRLEITVIGEAVNLASKMEKHNKVVGSHALVLASTFEMAKAQGYQPGLEFLDLKDQVLEGAGTRYDLVALK